MAALKRRRSGIVGRALLVDAQAQPTAWHDDAA